MFSQNENLSSEEALIQFQKLQSEINLEFPEDDIKTYQRKSFSENQLQSYLSKHFQCLDLLPHIKGNYALKLDTYLHSGNWFYNIGFSQQTINSYQKFFKKYKEFESHLTSSEKEKYIEMRNYAYSVLAESYAKLNKLDSAKITHLQNIEFSKTLKGIYYPSALNNYGLYFYWDKKDLSNALIYFNKAFEITQDSFPKHTLIGSIRDNIADIYTDQGTVAKALPLYQSNFTFYQKTPNEKTKKIDLPRLISAGAQLVRSHLKLNQIEQAEQAFLQLGELAKKNELNLSDSSKLEILKTEELLFLSQNKIKEAYATSKKVWSLSDSILTASKRADTKWRNELNNVTLDRVALNFKIERLQKENRLKNQRLKWWIITLILSIGIILLTSLVLRRRQYVINAKNKQLLAEKTLENTSLKVQKLNSEIKSKERDLTDFALNLSQNQEWAELLAQKIEILKQSPTKERSTLLDELENEVKNKITFDSNTKDFFERLDKLSDSFYSKLTKRFPNLSKTEIRLCSLIRLKIDSRSIASLQNITLASLNTSRYRLRKKLHLPEDVDLDQFIQSM